MHSKYKFVITTNNDIQFNVIENIRLKFNFKEYVD